MNTPRASAIPVAVLATLLAVTSLAATDSAAGGQPAQAAQPAPEVVAKLQARLDRWRVNHLAPGVAAAVRFPDGSLWEGVSGTAEVSTRAHPIGAARPVEIDTPFVIASITKTFMAALVLQLEEQGRLSLGDPISTWLPGYPRGRAITLRMLLNHRSGIYNYFEHPLYGRKVFGRPLHRWRVGEILSLTGRPYCRPGKCFHYSNTNYVLLAKIVKKVTGKRAGKLVRNRFLEPLDLTDTWFQGQERIGEWAAKGYWTTRKGYRDFWDGTDFRPNTSAATVAHAAGAMIASIRDLSDWQDALFDGRVLTPDSLEKMLDFHRKTGYGLGMRVAWLAGIPGVGHGGSLRGYVAIMYRLPQLDLDVSILTNLGNVEIQGLADTLTRVALRSLPEPTPSTSPSPSSGAPVGG
jgi:D-alanyl-D-alanine carboxypeptidase